MKHIKLAMILITIASLSSCSSKQQKAKDSFQWQIDQFADVRIMRYQVPGWDDLTLKQKEYAYYLSQAAICGRDILFDQNYRHNLAIRNILETVYNHYQGDRNNPNWDAFVVYLKRVWFSNGIHHHYSTDKIAPDFSQDYFAQLVEQTPAEQFAQELGKKEEFVSKYSPIIFDPLVDAKRVSQEAGADVVKTSANNYYRGVSQKEVENFYAKKMNPNDLEPVSYGLNSQLAKENGVITERVWKVGGMYGEAIEQIVYWLEKASHVTENDAQKEVIESLMDFYRTGDLKTFDEYSVLWTKDLDSHIDFVNGFIENYGDAMGYKGAWEAMVDFKDVEATKRTDILSSNAQWFEDNSPIAPEFKKEEVKGVSAKVIVASMLGGDCYPSTPIGKNLPNADWIRAKHGSKSATIDNITYAYDKSSEGNGFLEEFAWNQAEIDLQRNFGSLAGNLHTDLHECLGHGSGKLAPGVNGDELKQYSSVIEECRADLFALYYIMDEKMVELGLIPSLDVGKAEYNQYIRNGTMTQLTRIALGNKVEQAHMRNRQLIARWCFEHGKEDNVIEQRKENDKTFFVITDHQKLRGLFSQLLAEIQRIKSTGDFEAAQHLVETYAVEIDYELHKEVLERFAKLNIAPYGGFVNPVYNLIYDENNALVDIQLDYTQGYTEQMLEYSKNFSFLPFNN